MLSITHCAIAAAGTSLILGTAAPLPLGLAILGSQLPDLDTTTRRKYRVRATRGKVKRCHICQPHLKVFLIEITYLNIA